MPAFLGVPVVAAYHVVSVLASILTPLLSGLAAAAAIVLFTMGVRLLLLPLSYRAIRGMDAQARLAPRVQALQKEHAGHPDRLQRELSALYRAEGTSMLGGCLPLLAQWPFLSVMYLLFRSRAIGGEPNSPFQVTRVSSSRPRCFRSVTRAAEGWSTAQQSAR